MNKQNDPASNYKPLIADQSIVTIDTDVAIIIILSWESLDLQWRVICLPEHFKIQNIFQYHWSHQPLWDTYGTPVFQRVKQSSLSSSSLWFGNLPVETALFSLYGCSHCSHHLHYEPVVWGSDSSWSIVTMTFKSWFLLKMLWLKQSYFASWLHLERSWYWCKLT